MIGIKGKVTGAAAVANLLRGLEPKVFRPAARLAVSDCGTLVAREAKARVKRRTGSLAKSIGKKVKAMKSHKGYMAVVGPRRDPTPKEAAKMTTPPKAKYRRTVNHKGRVLVVDPAKYAHLVEYGRRAVTAGYKDVIRKGKKVVEETGKKVLSDGTTIYGVHVRAVPPDPFMRPAWAAAERNCFAIVKRRVEEAKRKAAKMRVK